ncbi:MAG: TonB-dependent receptor [Chitinophagaceae bacterium]
MKTTKGIPALCCMLLLHCLAIAQSNLKLNGAVQSADKKGIGGITVSLLKAKDSSLVKVAITAEDGHFEFTNLPALSFIVAVTGVGYEPYYSKPVALSTQQSALTMDAVTLTTKEKTLNQVTVTARKPLVERKIDRTVVNVDAFISNAGANALEVLEKSPGVQVDNNENIGLNGKSSVLIYIDDKPTYLSGADLANYLKSIPASSLERVELMTNPPAKYDAAGNAGIINIRTKKTKIKGFNGSVSAAYTQGKYPKTNNSINFNYRNNKINLFGTTSYSEATNFTNLDIERRIRNDDESLKTIFDQNSYIKRWNRSNNLKLGLDYYVTQKSTLGVVLNGMLNPSSENNFNTSNLKDGNNQLDSVITADNRQRTKFRNGSVNVNYRHQYDSTGRELTMDADYILYRFRTSQNNQNASYRPDNTVISQDALIGNLPSDIDIYSFKMDYTHPLPGNMRAEGGIKSSYTRTDNIADYQRTAGGVTSPDYDITNHFQYDENINAGYLNMNKEFKRWSIQAGLRLENTVSKGHQLGNAVKPDSAFKRTYTNLFPTFFISYKLDSNGNNQLTFSYGRRIERPYYRSLNPFVSPLDKFTYYTGNPFLQPQFSDEFELSHIFKNRITTTAYFNHIKNSIEETIELIGTKYYSRPGNLTTKIETGISVSGNITVAKWWTAVPFLMYRYLKVKSPLYTQYINTGGGFGIVSLTNQLSFDKGWGAELGGNYQSKVTNGQFQIKHLFQMSAGVQKKVLKNKGSVKLNVRDIFYTRVVYGTINNLQNGQGKWRNQSDSRTVTLSFTYSFGKAAGSRKKHDSGGAQSEQGRVN